MAIRAMDSFDLQTLLIFTDRQEYLGCEILYPEDNAARQVQLELAQERCKEATDGEVVCIAVNLKALHDTLIGPKRQDLEKLIRRE